MRTDHADELIAGNPGLRALARVLNGPETTRGPADEQAALSMFRKVTAASKRSRRLRKRPALLHSARRGAWVGAAGVFALSVSFAAAGYASVLPQPVQRVAHDLFGFAGVPGWGPQQPGTPVAGSSHTAAGRAKSRGHRSKSPSTRPSTPGPPGVPILTVSVAARTIKAGSAVTVTAQLTENGTPVPGAKLTLLEQAAGSQAWQTAAGAVTTSAGQATFAAQGVTTDAAFEVAGPGKAKSAKLHVTVILPVVVHIASAGHGPNHTMTVSCKLASRGDRVVLQVLSAGQWQDAQQHQLDRARQATFDLKAGRTSTSYRIELLATTTHGRSVSNRVVVAPHHHGPKGQHG